MELVITRRTNIEPVRKIHGNSELGGPNAFENYLPKEFLCLCTLEH